MLKLNGTNETTLNAAIVTHVCQDRHMLVPDLVPLKQIIRNVYTRSRTIKRNIESNTGGVQDGGNL